MAITLLNIAAIQLSNTGATIFGGSTMKATVVESIILTNTGTATESVNLYFRPGGASAPGRLICPKNLQLPPNAQVILDAEIILGVTGVAADTLYGSTTNLNVVDCVISGMQRDL